MAFKVICIDKMVELYEPLYEIGDYIGACYQIGLDIKIIPTDAKYGGL